MLFYLQKFGKICLIIIFDSLFDKNTLLKKIQRKKIKFIHIGLKQN